MEFKKLVIVLSITLSMVVAMMFGVSYGWYAYANAETKVTATTAKNAPTVMFKQTEYINAVKMMPILDEDRYKYANKNSFTVTVGENLSKYQVGVEISLKDIKMSEELKIANYKYELLQDGEVVKKGNFDITGEIGTLPLMPMTVLKPQEYPKTYTYEFYVWLSDDGTNQNYLMNKGFSAKININSATKK